MLANQLEIQDYSGHAHLSLPLTLASALSLTSAQELAHWDFYCLMSGIQGSQCMGENFEMERFESSPFKYICSLVVYIIMQCFTAHEVLTLPADRHLWEFPVHVITF